ncbi:MAG TPA: ATPase domain-containing protein [Candidatus Thermoplasmatota archaeon]|nr:ATPase domain-containing protein [Candidatus Thermoplasmatota archaeon]
MTDSLLPTGIPDLDGLLGGFRIGDNVILQAQVGTPPQAFVRAFLTEALRRGDRAFFVSFDHSPATVLQSLEGLPAGDFTLVDCFTHGKGRSEDVFVRFYERAHPPGVRVVRVEMPQHPSQFHEAFDRLTRGDSRDCIVVDSLTGMAELWRSEDRVREFYTHTCPRLFDTRALAIWVAAEAVHSEAFRAHVGHIAQVVLRLDRRGAETTLLVERAVGRNNPGTYTLHKYEELEGGRLRLTPKR